jgi:phosphoglycerate dehydrogenase-like enzyme
MRSTTGVWWAPRLTCFRASRPPAKNCIVTPHTAWASKEPRMRLLKTAIANHDYGADYGDNNAAEIEAGDTA